MPGIHFERLPKCAIPSNYKLTLQPDLKSCTFTGKVKIQLEVKESTKTLILNANELNIDTVSFVSEKNVCKPHKTELNTLMETVTFEFDESLPLGKALLDISFNGKLNDQLRGFYRNKYTVGSEDRYGAVTQFESTDARRCFPCWDEPAIKATFDVVLIVPANRVALSNMPIEESVPHPSDKTLNILKFGRTPVMSTYLLACIVGEYDYVEKVLSSGVVVRVYTPLDKKEQGEFALDVSAKILAYYEEYFKIKYPLPKLDLIAISDFSIGAMENWGLITYREVALLVDPKNTSLIRKQNTVTIIAHEIAHMWFGNLVTMEWWTDLWLKEGYATFGQFLCTNAIFPEYDIWKQFVADSFVSALELDALKNSHPIEVPVGHPSEVEEIFDRISYEKGASVIRMIHDYIGDEDFRKGMHAYLERHLYSNTETNDLWRALSEASGKPIGDVMSGWTKQLGFPLVSVSSNQDGSNRVLQLSQAKFSAQGNSESNANTQWKVPMTFLSPSMKGTPTKFLLDSESSQVVLDNVGPDEWVKVNVNSIGFYRVKYPQDMLEQLIGAVSSKALSSLDRLGVIDDLFAQVQAGISSTVDLLRFLKSYENETEYVVWSAIDNICSQICTLLSHTSFQDSFKMFVRNLYRKIFAQVGWEPKPNESHLDTLLRTRVLFRLGMYGEESVVNEARQRLFAHMQGTNILKADIRGPVYRTIMNVADEALFNQMLQLYRQTDMQEERRRISDSFGATKDPNLIQKVLDFAMSDEVRSQDAVFVIHGLTGSCVGRNASWQFLKANIRRLYKLYAGGNLFIRLVKDVTDTFASEDMAVEVEEFFSGENVPEAERAIKQSVECIRLNEAWLRRDAGHIEAFLKKECA